MPTLSELASFLDTTLNIDAIPDYPNAVNGVQLANFGAINGVATAVDLFDGFGQRRHQPPVRVCCSFTTGCSGAASADDGASSLAALGPAHARRRGLFRPPSARRASRIRQQCFAREASGPRSQRWVREIQDDRRWVERQVEHPDTRDRRASRRAGGGVSAGGSLQRLSPPSE